jgi:hypothetical protein
MRIGDTVLELCRIKCMDPPKVHVVHLLIRRCENDGVRFLLYPHGKRMTAAGQAAARTKMFNQPLEHGIDSAAAAAG